MNSHSLARSVAERYGTLPQVESVALGGGGLVDDFSDVDFYVYSHRLLTLDERQDLVPESAVAAQVGFDLWEPGDEWVDGLTGVKVDVTLRTVKWAEQVLDALLLRHRASLGYSTALWHNLRTSTVLFARSSWFEALQSRAGAPIPPELRANIVTKNLAALSGTHSSYLSSLRTALLRGDAVAANHRLAAILASIFDVLFALNDELHPGEKRLLTYAELLCPLRPRSFSERVEGLLRLPGSAHDELLAGVEALVSDVQELCESELPQHFSRIGPELRMRREVTDAFKAASSD